MIDKVYPLLVSTLFREFRFTSEVPIWLDYHGKHVVIEQVSGHSEILSTNSNKKLKGLNDAFSHLLFLRGRLQGF